MNTLQLIALGANQTEIRFADKTVLFSYNTPVAYRDNQGREFYSTTKHSKTTSKHVNRWLNNKKTASAVDQAAITASVRG